MNLTKTSFALLGLFGFSLLSCSKNGKDSVKESSELLADLEVHLNQTLSEKDKQLLIKLQYVGESPIETLFPIEGDSFSVSLTELTPADSVSLQGAILDENTLVRYVGSGLTNLTAGQVSQAQLQLKPNFVELSAKVPLGVGNPYGVATGDLRLFSPQGDTLESSLNINSRTQGVFEVGEVFFGEGYTLHISLQDSAGSTLFEKTQTLAVNEDLEDGLTLHLESLFGVLDLSLIVLSPEEKVLGVQLPGSKVRNNIRQKELRFTELLANPKTSGDDFEYIELYNASIDTLDFASCTIKRSVGSTGSTSVMSLEETPLIPPGSYWVFGRDSVGVAHSLYSGLTMLNSGQSLYLICDDLVIDEIDYAGGESNVFELQSGKSIELSLSGWETPEFGASWCLGSLEVPFTPELTILGSPGQENSCQ